MKKILLILIVVFLGMGSVVLYADKTEESKRYFNEGLQAYLKRDFKNAVEKWQKAFFLDNENKKVKEYLDKAQAKYYDSVRFFNEGVAFFKNADYTSAEKSFQDSLMINPLDEKVKSFLRLCSIPKIEFVSAPAVTARYPFPVKSTLEMNNCPSGWIGTWILHLTTTNGKEFKTVQGKGWPPPTIQIDLHEDLESLADISMAQYFLTLTSAFGRVVVTSTNPFPMDNVGPRIKVSSVTNFFTGRLRWETNKLFVGFDIKDRSGIENAVLEISDANQGNILESIPVKDLSSVILDVKKYNVSRIICDVRANDTLLNENVSTPVSVRIIPPKRTVYQMPMNLPDIEFAVGRAELTRKSLEILDSATDVIDNYPEATFIIEGHACNIGTKENNVALSRKRAETVRDYLLKKNQIRSEQLILKGYGYDRAKEPNDNEIHRKQNRRVEVFIINE